MSAATLDNPKTTTPAPPNVKPSSQVSPGPSSKSSLGERPRHDRGLRSIQSATLAEQAPGQRKRRIRRFDPTQGPSRLRVPRRGDRPRTQPARQRSEPSAPQEVSNPFSLERLFVYFSYAVSLFLIVLFGLDLVTGVPFKRLHIVYDVANLVGGVVLAYLTWNTHRDLS